LSSLMPSIETGFLDLLVWILVFRIMAGCIHRFRQVKFFFETLVFW
jgi:hypothetical protein